MATQRRRPSLHKLNRRKEKFFPLRGGLNLVDPPLVLPPGVLLGARNYEQRVRGGYRRIDGFEGYDGNPRPSAADYWILNFNTGTVAISDGDTITGASSGATGEVIVDAVVESGSYVGGDAAGYIVFTLLTGNFTDTENIQVSAATRAVASGTELINSATLNSDHLDWKYEAAEVARALISVVPGSGQIRGVYVFSGDIYAFRDNAGATACVMHKASSSGWVEQDLGETIDFTAGTTEFLEEETLADGTATATIKRVVVQSGAWSTNDAAGYITLYGVTNGPFTSSVTITSASGSATSATVNVANTLTNGGRYELITHNFFGHTKTIRMYGANGLDYAFEWDGAVFTQIRTGMTTDTPAHVEEHKNHLFLSFSGGSLQHSSVGDPLTWSVILGAAELGLGEEITAIKKVVDESLAIAGRNELFILYGSDSSTWELRTLSEETGALEWTLQKVGRVRYLDDRGVTELAAVQAYGNFKDATISHLVQPLIDAKKNLISASTIVRSKNQYRLFFTDNTGIIMTFESNKLTGITELDYGTPVRVATSEEDSSGDEVLYFGSDDGYIYQAEKGTSFDGSAIVAWQILPYHHYGSPSVKKRFYRVTPEIDADADAVIYIQPDFSYGDPDIPAQAAVSVLGGGGEWNIDNWGEFLWSAQVVSTGSLPINGVGVNLGMRIYSSTDREPPHTIHGMTTQYSSRTLTR